MQSEKGRIFLKFMVRAMVCGLRRIPGVELGVDLYEGWREAAAEVCAEQEKVSHEERIARLENAAGFSPSEAQTLSREVMAEMRKQGEVISEAKEQLIAELSSVAPALIRERTQATLRQARSRGTALHTALPIAEGGEAHQAFYQSLFPRRRPRFQVGDAVPHRTPRWEVVQLLGLGGFGEVWEVRNPHLPDHFAVKFCQDEVSAKVLKREAQALIVLCRQLPRHPHIARLLELQLEQEPYWLAFEYVKGGTLEALLRTGPLPWAESLKIFRALVEAMSAVHQEGIVHRDLKPANILLTEHNEVKIADFGIGKVLADQEAISQQTCTRFTSIGYGTIGYMSVEQARGESAHPADDTFALGVLLWQMLSGSLQPPPPNLFRKINQLPAPQAIQNLILDCVTGLRNERPQNAMVLFAVLKDLAENRQEEPLEPPRSSSPSVAVESIFRDKLKTVLNRLAENRQEKPSELPRPSSPSVVAGTTFRDQLKDGSKGPEMVWIPVGKFIMGDNQRGADEKPAHEVTIAYALAIGKYPVTFAEYDKFCEATEREKPGDWGCGRGKRPMINVSWKDAQAYCRWLNEQTGKPYRLPSESEWEYACCAGTTTQYSFGDDEKELKNYAWYDGNSKELIADGLIEKLFGGKERGRTHPVGEKKPNPWGLYDMHGNVWEWCEDVWHPNYQGAPTDESAWITGGEQNQRLLRGGSWNLNAYICRSAYRSRYDDRLSGDGFRLSVFVSR